MSKVGKTEDLNETGHDILSLHDMPDKPNILIVGDTSDNEHEIEGMLTVLDLHIFHVHSNTEAISFIKREEFALVFIYVNLPYSKVFELVKTIRSRKGSEFLNIVLITSGSNDVGYLEKWVGSGDVDHISRPLNPDLLRGKTRLFIKQYINRKYLLSEIEKRDVIREELQNARAEAEKAAMSKQQFLSNMSHEIRTSLNAVVNCYQLLRDEHPRSDQLESLDILKISTESLLQLVNSIVEYSKIDAGKIEFDHIGFDIRKLMSGIFQCSEPDTSKKKIGLELQIDKRIPPIIKGDPVRLKQILMNLLSNAIKFTERGKVMLDAVMLIARDQEIEISFRVSDTGIGIAKEGQKHIFERYSQANPSVYVKYGGTGLGLAIARMLIELQGGHLELISKLHKGSTFSFSLTFPLNQEEQLPVKEPGISVNPVMDGLRILIVEDNFENQRVVSKILSRWNIIIDIAENGKVAVDKIRKNTYDLVLMDLHMPDMNGYDATKNIRGMKGQYFKHLPIIAMTATAFMEDHSKIISSGMNGFIIKPFTPQELYKKITDFTIRIPLKSMSMNSVQSGPVLIKRRN